MEYPNIYTIYENGHENKSTYKEATTKTPNQVSSAIALYESNPSKNSKPLLSKQIRTNVYTT